MGYLVSQAPTRIGKCSIKVQGKILVKLEGNLPKIGALAKIKKDNHFKVIGEVTEAIGSTRNPWIVISVKKNLFNSVQPKEDIFTGDSPQRDRKRKKKHIRKHPRKRS